jgi:uroporphyrinogen-III synthase
MSDTKISDDRLTLAIDRLGGLEEIHRKPYAEFFEDAEILSDAARELLSLRAPVDLRTLVPGFRLDWSGLRNRLEEDLARLEKLDTYEMRSAHLDEMARQFEDAIRSALPTVKKPTDEVGTARSA